MKDRVITRALVRAPGASFARAISSSGAAIDVALAQAQHAEYCQALTAAGVAVEALPADERYPDSCFMQDPALVIGDRAVICRLAVASRQGEEAAAAGALAQRGFAAESIVAPGTLEGGDVLHLPGRVLVGQTARSNIGGTAQLAAFLAPLGLPVSGVPVPGYLHLLSAVTYLGQNVLLAAPEYLEHPALAGFDVIPVVPGDVYAVNALAIGSHVVLPAGYSRVGQAIADRGFTVLPVPTSEFAKADGGVTCLSLAW